MAANEMTNSEILSGVSIIIGVITGAAIPLVKDYINGRRAEKLERIKLHDIKKLEAYREAFEFVEHLKLSMKSTDQSADLLFINACSGRLHIVIVNLPYLSKKIRNEFINLQNLVEKICSTIMQVEENSHTVTNTVPQIIFKLNRLILEDFSIWE